MDIIEFKKIVSSTVSQLAMKPIEYREAGITPNFHFAHVKGVNFEFGVICSIEDNWAFCKYIEPMICELDFIDHESLSQILRDQFCIKVLTTQELNGQFVKEPYMHNSDIKYWQPKSKGEGLFNWWD